MGKYKFNPLVEYLFDLTGTNGKSTNTGGDGNTQPQGSIMDYLHDARYDAERKELVITQDAFFASNDYLNDAEYLAESKTLNVIPLIWKN